MTERLCAQLMVAFQTLPCASTQDASLVKSMIVVMMSQSWHARTATLRCASSTSFRGMKERLAPNTMLRGVKKSDLRRPPRGRLLQRLRPYVPTSNVEFPFKRMVDVIIWHVSSTSYFSFQILTFWNRQSMQASILLCLRSSMDQYRQTKQHWPCRKLSVSY